MKLVSILIGTLMIGGCTVRDRQHVTTINQPPPYWPPHEHTVTVIDLWESVDLEELENPWDHRWLAIDPTTSIQDVH